MLECGDTFLAGDSENEDFHLRIVLTPPTEGEVVVVCVTSKRKKSETLVELHKGDHEFIEHDSVVSYAYTQIKLVDDIESAIASGAAIKKEKASEALLSRLRAGLLESDRTPNGVRAYYRSVMPD